MLQQTQVETVIPYYRRFLARFPSVKALAEAHTDQVLKSWENLGYYSRARHLHAAAKEVVACRGGKIPQTRRALLSLPGIGEYTAAAVLSMAFGKPVAAIDGNVLRVISRLFALRGPVGSSEYRQKVHNLADQLLSKKKPGLFNQAMMDLGATVCTPRDPSCPSCPVKGLCMAENLGLQENIPAPGKRPAPLHKHMTAAILMDRKKRVLVVQRPASGLLGGLWKFPGGERRAKEALESALARTVREELGVSVRVQKPVASVKHAYTHFRVTFHVYRCALEQGRPKATEKHRWMWVSEKELRRLALSKAERKILGVLYS